MLIVGSSPLHPLSLQIEHSFIETPVISASSASGGDSGDARFSLTTQCSPGATNVCSEKMDYHYGYQVTNTITDITAKTMQYTEVASVEIEFPGAKDTSTPILSIKTSFGEQVGQH